MIFKIIKTDYPKEKWSEVESLLNFYGCQPWHAEIDRVKIAILKLSNGDIKELKFYVDDAGSDYRNVLAYAEEPNIMKLSHSNNAEKIKQARKMDKEQYEKWASKYK